MAVEAAYEPIARVVRGGAPILVGSPVYNEIAQFLYEEAALLDQRRLGEWAERLAQDLVYTAPLRVTRTTAGRADDIVRTMAHFDDNYGSIMGRIARLSTKSAWAEDPPSRTRRLITNILVFETDNPDEIAVTSYLYITRSRHEYSDFQVMSAERHDLIRRAGGGLKLARREIIIDQSVLGMQNFAVFL